MGFPAASVFWDGWHWPVLLILEVFGTAVICCGGIAAAAVGVRQVPGAVPQPGMAAAAVRHAVDTDSGVL